MPIQLSLPILCVLNESFLGSFSENFIVYLQNVRHCARCCNRSLLILQSSKTGHLKLEWATQSPGELVKTPGPISRVFDL